MKSILFVLLWCITVIPLPAQVDPSATATEYDSALLEFYLDKADKQTSQYDWFRMADYGVEVVRAQWEAALLLIHGEDIDLPALRESLNTNLKSIVEQRLTRYLINQFFQKLNGPELGNLLQVIDEQNLKFLYQVDDSDNILRDSSGKPLFRKSAGLFDVSKEDESGNIVLIQQGEKTQWSRAVQASMDEVLKAWGNSAFTAYSDILETLDSPKRRRFAAQYAISIEKQKTAIRRQMDHLFLREQNNLITSRIYDRNSLEYQTQEQTARVVSERLISQTETQLAEGLESLRKGLEGEPGKVSREGLAVNQNEWQKSFRLLMSQGLADWDKAEERFLIKRLEWETEIGDQMKAGEEAWAEAFQRIRKKRSEWFDQFKSTLEKGSRLWTKENEKLTEVINRARAELEQNISNRKMSMQNRIDNLVGMLLQSVNMMRTARSSWVYWMDKADSEELGTFDHSQVGYDIWSMRKSLVQIVLDKWKTISTQFEDDEKINSLNQKNKNAYQFAQAGNFILFLLDELGKSHDASAAMRDLQPDDALLTKIYKSYSDKNTDSLSKDDARTAMKAFFNWYGAEKDEGNVEDEDLSDEQKKIHDMALIFDEAIYWSENMFRQYAHYSSQTQKQLISTYGIVVFGDDNDKSAFTSEGRLNDELLSTDMLYDDERWENLYLDDFQVELLKARAYKQYWEKQLDIAHAVMNYADDESSGKENADDTLRKLEKTKNEYNNALDAYNSRVAELEKIGDYLDSRQDEISSIQKAIKIQQEKLAQFRDEYKKLVDEFIINNPQYLKDKFQGFYKELLALKGLDPENSTNTQASAMEEYLAAARKYNLSHNIALISNKLKVLLNGENIPLAFDKRDNPAFYSLIDLKKNLADIRTFELKIRNKDGQLVESDFLRNVEKNLHVNTNSRYYNEFSTLFSEISRTGHEKLVMWKMLRLVEHLEENAERLLENRMAEIRLLASDNFQSWFDVYFSDSTGKTTDEKRLEHALNPLGDSEELSEIRIIEKRIQEEYTYIESLITQIEKAAPQKLSDFRFFDWSKSEDLTSLSKLNNPDSAADMRKQVVWEHYYSHYGENTARQLQAAADSLKNLYKWWNDSVKKGKLLTRLKESEVYITQALKDNTHEYLKNFVNGGGFLLTRFDDVGAYLIREERKTRDRKTDLASIVDRNMDMAHSLRGIMRDKNFKELKTWLSTQGLISDTAQFISPEHIVSNRNFPDSDALITWMYELEKGASRFYTVLPDFVTRELQAYLIELREYMAVVMVKSYREDILESTDSIQKDIDKAISRQNSMREVLNLIKRSHPSEAGKLKQIAQALGEGTELYDRVINKFIETAALDLVVKALSDGENSISDSDWKNYLAVEKFDDEELSEWKDDIMTKADHLITLAKAVNSPEKTDWNAVTDEELHNVIRNASYNSLDADSALQAMNELNLGSLLKVLSSDESTELINREVNSILTVNSTVTVLVDLANDKAPGSLLFRKIFVYGLNNLLEGLSESYSSEILKGIKELLIHASGMPQLSIDDIAAIDGAAELKDIMNADELIHYYSGKLLSDQLSSWGPFDHLDDEDKVKVNKALEEFQSRIMFSRSYSPSIHGDLFDYAKMMFPDNTEQQLQVMSQELSKNTAELFWDNPFFWAKKGHDAQSLIRTLRRLRSYEGNNTEGRNANDALYQYVSKYLSQEDLSKTIFKLGSKKSLLDKAIAVLSDYSRKRKHWRTYLQDSYLYSVNNVEKNGPGGSDAVKVDSDDRAERDIRISEDSDETGIFAEPGELTLLKRAEDDLDNWFLDERNDFLDAAAFLTSAMEAMISSDDEDETNRFNWLDKDWLKKGDLPTLTVNDKEYSSLWTWLEGRERSKVNTALEYQASGEGEYSRKFSVLRNIQKRITELKQEMHTNSNLIFTIETVGTDSGKQRKTLIPIRNNIEKSEKLIADNQSRWQKLIDNALELEEGKYTDLGYKQLSELYQKSYLLAKDAFRLLQTKRHEYAKARAVFQYSSAGYIRADDDSLTESDDDNGDDELLEAINRVSPRKRLAYVKEKSSRAGAAYDALYQVITDNKAENYTIYSNNETYAAHFDAYLKTFRDDLTIQKMNSVLGAAIARQDAITRKAHRKWQEARTGSFAYKPFDEHSRQSIKDKGLRINRNEEGKWHVDWSGSESGSDKDFDEYFSAVKSDKYGLSPYENDLHEWLRTLELRKNNNQQEFSAMIHRWVMAMHWETYQEYSQEEKDAYYNKVVSDQSHYSPGKGDILRTLKASWQNAWNTTHSSDEEKALFNFFKLVQKNGGVSIGDKAENFADINLDKETAYTMINNSLRPQMNIRFILGAGLLSYAAACFAAAAALFAVPFGWIGALGLIALGALTLVKGSEEIYQGNLIKDTLTMNQNKMDSSRRHRESFETILSKDLANIESLRQTYEKEQKLLELLQGENSNSENLELEDQIGSTAKSIRAAFTLNQEDLNGLLIKSGRVKLEDLLSDYSEDIDKELLATYSNSTKMISAISESSYKRKQNTSRALNDYLNQANGVIAAQKDAQTQYEQKYREFMFGKTLSLDNLKASVNNAFAKPSFSIREHLLRLFENQNKIAQDIFGGNHFNLSESADLMALQKTLLAGDSSRSIKGMYDYRYDSYMAVRENEFSIKRLEAQERYKHWEAQMKAILARGQMEWNDGERRMKDRYDDWMKNVNKEYTSKKDAWNTKYLDFLRDKNQWLNVVSWQSTRIGDVSVLENFGKFTQGSIRSAGSDILISTLAEASPDATAILGEMVNLDLLGGLFKDASSLNHSVGDFTPVVFSSLGKDKYTTAELLQSIKDFQGLQNQEYRAHVSRMEYSRMLERLALFEKNFNEQVKMANTRVDGSLHRMLREDNYTRSGNVYKKNIIVGSSVFDGMLLESGLVDAYSDYSKYRTRFTDEVKISGEELDSMDAQRLEGLLDKAMLAIKTETRRVFGAPDDPSTIRLNELGLMKNVFYDENADRGEDDGKHAAYRYVQAIEQTGDLSKHIEEAMLSKSEQNPESSTSEILDMVAASINLDGMRGVNVSPGDFGLHVGYAPTFRDGKDLNLDAAWTHNLRFEGKGQMGQVMGQFIFNKFKNSAGLAQVNLPIHHQKYWDDRGSWVQAPTVGGMTKTLVSLATLPAAPLASAAAGFAASAAFTTADMASGLLSVEDGLLSIGKSAVISAASFGSGQLAETGLGFADTLAGNMGQKIVMQAGNNAASGLVNGFNIEKGSLTWNADVLTESLFGKQAIAGYAMGMAQLGTNSLFQTTSQGFWGDSFNDYASLGRLASTAVSEGVNYAITGNASFNVLMLSDLLSPITGPLKNTKGQNIDSGLFKINLTRDGMQGTISSGGSAVGIGGIINAVKGLDELDANIRIALDDDKKHTIGLRSLYSNNSETGLVLFDDIVSDSAILEENIDLEGAKGKTVFEKGKRVIQLGKKHGSDLSEQLNLSVILEHESYRDGLIGEKNDEETFEAVLGHMLMAGKLSRWFGDQFMIDDNIKQDFAVLNQALANGDMEEFSRYVESVYDSSGDFWKLMDDGTVVWDGSHNLNDQDGNLLLTYRGTETGDPRKSLAWFLDYDNLDEGKDDVNQKMIAAKWDYLGENKYSVGKGGTDRLDIGNTLSNRMFYAVNKDLIIDSLTLRRAMYHSDADALTSIQNRLLQNRTNYSDRFRRLEYIVAQFLYGKKPFITPEFNSKITQKMGNAEYKGNYPTRNGELFHPGTDVAGLSPGTIRGQSFRAGFPGVITDPRQTVVKVYDSPESWLAAKKKGDIHYSKFDIKDGQYVHYERGYGNSVDVQYQINIFGTSIPIAIGRFAHADELFVNMNQRVYKSSPLGAIGNTGSSTGPHMHFELKSKKNWGADNIIADYFNLESYDDLQKNDYYKYHIFYNADKLWR